MQSLRHRAKALEQQIKPLACSCDWPRPIVKHPRQLPRLVIDERSEAEVTP